MNDQPPGPRDWEPSDPDAFWWNPKAGDAYGPSDQEHRPMWEGPAPVRRFATGPGDSLGPDADRPPRACRQQARRPRSGRPPP